MTPPASGPAAAAPSRLTALLVAALVVVASVALVLHSLVWNFVTDDAFISFVYSRNLADHGQLVFNLGERVEGYTNFLWTVILAGLYKVGLQPERMSRFLGTACAIATLVVVTRLARRLRRDDAGPDAIPWCLWDAVPALFLVAVPGYACWSSGGLETQLFTLLVTAGFSMHLAEERSDRPGRLAPLLFGLAALTRPEGFLFFALVQAHRLGRRVVGRTRLVRREDFVAAGIFLALVVPHLVWRRAYYGYWLPNTFYIKASGGAAAFAQGGYYLFRVSEQFHLWVVPLLVVAALVRGGWARPGFRLLLPLWLVVTGVFALYVASVGGDFMGLFRFVMPVIPLTILVAVRALGAALGPIAGRTAVAAPIVALLLAGHVAHAVRVDKASLAIGADRGIDTPGFLRWYTADRAAIGKWFGARRQPDDFAAVGGAGAQVWYSQMASLDCFGLSDAYIAHQVKPVSVRPGHQKYAPLEYQLSRKPTIITSNYYRIQGTPYVPTAGESAMWHTNGYRYVSARIPGLSSPWYSFLLRNDRTLPDTVDTASPSGNP